MYGAIHRAQFNGARNLRGLIIDEKMLAETGFRLALTDAKSITALTRLDHAGLDADRDGRVRRRRRRRGHTRGVGRYVSVQDLISATRANKATGGKLSLHVAGTIGKAVIEAARRLLPLIGVVHGAVHPRSVLIDEDGAVKLTDFVVGRALTTAVAQGADSSLWRGLAGYLAPELVVGEDPSPGVDVFAVGAMLFTMLSGEVPPGALHVSPAVERLVQRALDTGNSRRLPDRQGPAREPARGVRGRPLGSSPSRGEADQGRGAIAVRRQHRRRHRRLARLAGQSRGSATSRSRRSGRARRSAPRRWSPARSRPASRRASGSTRC